MSLAHQSNTRKNIVKQAIKNYFVKVVIKKLYEPNN